MQRIRCAALAAILAAAGCSGSSGSSGASIEEIRQALQSCTQTSVLDLLRIFGILAEVADAAEGSTIDGVTVTPSMDVSDPPNTFDFTAAFPADGTGPDDTTVDGKVTFSADPTDGIADGDTFSVMATVTSNGGPLSGTVNLQGTIGQSVLAGELPPPEADPVFAVQGMMSLVNSLDGCMIDATFDTPFIIDFQPGPSQVTARILGTEMFGSFTLSLTALGSTLTSTIAIPAGGQTAQVDGELLGEEFDFTTELFPPEEDVFATLFCFESSSFLVNTLVEAIQDIEDAIENPQDHPDVEITATSTPGTFDYVVTRPGLTISGVVTVPLTGTGTATLTFDLAGSPVIAGLEQQFTGMNVGGPLSIAITGGMVESLFGALQFSLPSDSCTATFTVPAADPVSVDLETSGTVVAEVVRGDVTVTATIDLSAEPEDEFISSEINGIPVPADILFSFGD